MEEFEIEYKLSTLDELEDLFSDLLDIFRENSEDEFTKTQVDAVFRIVHSVKGNSKACDFEELSNVSHCFEDLLLKVKNEEYEFTKEILELSLDYCDEVSKAIEETRKDLSFKPIFTHLLDRLKNYEPSRSEDNSVVEVVDEEPTPALIKEFNSNEETKNTKILLVDDDENLKILLSTQIKTYFPSNIKEACNGNEASKSCMRVQYDVIICDFQMPVMDGQTFIKTLRENYSLNQKTPVIFLTAFNPILISDAKVWNDVFLLKKPIEKSKLIYYMRCALEIKNKQELAS
ncbi:hypothetical protein A9Q84_07880 [Halobacteriovorax marinus]|uniref:Response regulatory domain-containing protein n=1 Tax=Halobacteriovorax marinus TaxID=97084 RepID=A0A1Y5F5U8_9BACT|nr:hypothetical protein A9Q84_07880 [Halobacteriovorax marinus]